MKKMKGYPLPLGVSEYSDSINFSVVVEGGKECILKLYKKGSEEAKEEIYLLEEDGIGEVRFVALPKTGMKQMEYVYEIDGNSFVDPYAKSVIETENGVRGRIVFEEYDWEEDKVLKIPEEDVIAYSLHVRGFTKHASSKVKKKGTFQGVIEKIPYLQELGINQIQCMPVYSFKETYWGYGSAYVYAVKNLYAAGAAPEKELKDMIKACHRAGIEVILHMPFEGTMNQSEILTCLRYYAIEYHVDGFVLNPYVISLEEAMKDPILKGVKILQKKDDFQTVMRCFLKGDQGMVNSVMQWLRKDGATNQSYNYITDHLGFTLADLVSYNEKHNEANGEGNQDGPEYNHSWNCGEEGPTKEKAIKELRKKQIRNALFLLLFANGTPCMLAGDEFANSQGGNNNAYNQDNETAWLDWKDLEREKELFEYVKMLIKLRRGFKPLLNGTNNKDGVPTVSYHGKGAWQVSNGPESRQLGVYYHNEICEIQDCYVAYNMLWYKQEFALPELLNGKKWHRIVSTEDGIMEESVEAEGRMTVVPGRTIVLFVGK